MSITPTTLIRRPYATFDLTKLDAFLPKPTSRPLLVRPARFGVVALRVLDLVHQLFQQAGGYGAVQPQRIDLGGYGFVNLTHRPLRIFPPAAPGRHVPEKDS